MKYLGKLSASRIYDIVYMLYAIRAWKLRNVSNEQPTKKVAVVEFVQKDAHDDKIANEGPSETTFQSSK